MLRRLICFVLIAVCPLPAISGEKQDGFVSLFDGKTLDGWMGDGKKYFVVEDGNMICQAGCRGKLLAEKEYGDFVLRFEFKLSEAANNGLAIRAPVEGDAAYAGIELQILDNSADVYQDLKDFQFHGSAYGIAPAKRGALKPVGQWNSQEVYCQGRRIRVTLNKTVILDIDLDEVAPGNKTMDGKEHPGLQRKSGHLGFLCHNDPVSFRNIQIKELTRDQRE